MRSSSLTANSLPLLCSLEWPCRLSAFQPLLAISTRSIFLFCGHAQPHKCRQPQRGEAIALSEDADQSAIHVSTNWWDGEESSYELNNQTVTCALQFLGQSSASSTKFLMSWSQDDFAPARPMVFTLMASVLHPKQSENSSLILT